MSNQRYCAIYLATDGKWYLALADYGDNDNLGENEDSPISTYGPFSSAESADKYLNRFSNPGGYMEDGSGTRKPPKDAIRPKTSRYNPPMNIRPKSKIVLDIVDAIHASTHDFIEEELTKFEEYLISHGATKTVAKAIMNEVRLLI